MVGVAKTTATVKSNHPDVLLHGERDIGVMGGGGQSPIVLESLMELQGDGRFPLEKFVTFYDFADPDRAVDSNSGQAVKPILRMS
jgi:aryl-alcohol dehydrogenase